MPGRADRTVDTPFTVRELSVVSRGDFGEKVAQALVSILPGAVSVVPHSEVTPDRLASARIVIVASWKEDVDALLALDQVCHAQGALLLPVVAQSPVVRIGPLCGRGPSCYACYARRVWQHDPDPPLIAAVHRAFAEDTELGVRGFIAPQAFACAAVAARLVCDPAVEEVAGRTVYFWNMATAALRSETVVPVHGCVRCYEASRCGIMNRVGGRVTADRATGERVRDAALRTKR